MKRLRKAARVVLVWLSICLLMVDPAAACRWLAGRRCCCCPCECPPTSCGGDSKPAPGGFDGWPSAVAPAAPGSGGLIPQLELSDLLPAFENARPSTNDPSAPAPSAPPVASDGGATTEPPAAAVRPTRPPATKPAFAAPPSGRATTRRPGSTAPQPITDPPSPAALDHASSPATTAAEPAAPIPTTITPRQDPQPVVSARTPPETSTPPTAAPQDDATSPTARRSDESSLRIDAIRPSTNRPKPPAAPAGGQPPTPVAPPAFPPVDDDPFAPLNPGTPRTPTTRPDEDDPFAPIGSQPTFDSRSAAPSARDPVAVAKDMLPPADGRLPLRQWNDNSGQFRVSARLVLILDGKVRLLKETGRTTTVPMERLSAVDRAYVAEVVARYGNDLTKLTQLAAR